MKFNEFVFFSAGFETSSTTLSYCLYELALDKNKHIQDEARREIRSTLDKYDGNLTYDAIHEMTYIDQIINGLEFQSNSMRFIRICWSNRLVYIVSEALRKHPPASNLIRVATKNYKVPNSHYTIPKGMMVLIPIYGIHHDPDYYENPEEFEPKRFTPEEVKMRPSCSFLPFGDG